MTTLLQTYITDRPPSEWKSLFKEACNIGFMVKYMFREDLQIAKQKFVEAVGNKDNFRKMPRGGEVSALSFPNRTRTAPDPTPPNPHPTWPAICHAGLM